MPALEYSPVARTFRSIANTALLVAAVATTAFGSYMPAIAGKAEPQGLRWKDRVIKIAVSNSVVDQNTNIKTDSDVIGAIVAKPCGWERVSDVRIEFELSDRLNVSLREPMVMALV
ncbi:MAG: hypothetical protein IPP63_19275 [Chloracidobacterium sp.]|nr:hypothetical protein [Chloracidobacterium sp.]